MGAAARREREIEAAWREHEPARIKAAWRAVEKFRAEIASDGVEVKRLLKGSALPLIHDWAKRGALGRDRKLMRIREALAPASVETPFGALTIMWAEPRGPIWTVDHPSFRQDCVLVVAAWASRVRGKICFAESPVAEIPNHCLSRMYERRPFVDARATLYEAARAFLAADRRAVEAARLKGETIYLPAEGGLLLSWAIQCHDLEGKTRLIARANTFIGEEMAGPDQRPIAPAADPSRSVLAAAVAR